MSSFYTQIKAASKFVRDPSLRWKLECLLRGLRTENMALSCAQFGIHRSTAYRWLDRLARHQWNPEALYLRSRRPHHSPGLMDVIKQQRILWYRNEFHYGEDRIAWYLCREGLFVSPHGVRNVLKRAQVPFRKRRDQKPNRHTRRYNLDRPGQGVQLDIKFVPFPIEEQKVYVFNAVDDCSRWRFQYAYLRKGVDEACDFLQRLLEAAPFLIELLQTDNETCFTYRFLQTPHETDPPPHPFEQLLKAKSIRHKLIPPGIKELNGKVERSHKTDDQEFYWRLPLWISFAQFQRELLQWTFEYNHYRPHSSLRMKTPSQILEAFGCPMTQLTSGLWKTSEKPTHYQAISDRLQNHRREHPDTPLIHWRFKPKGPQTRENPLWQENTPSAIKAVSQMSGWSTEGRSFIFPLDTLGVAWSVGYSQIRLN